MDLQKLFRDYKVVREFPAGSVIFEQGSPGEVMYVVLEGEIDIRNNGRSLAIVGPGEPVGEMALISNEPRSATAFAVSDCRLAEISEDRFRMLVQFHPDFALAVMRVMAQRLRRTDLLAGTGCLRGPVA